MFASYRELLGSLFITNAVMIRIKEEQISKLFLTKRISSKIVKMLLTQPF